MRPIPPARNTVITYERPIKDPSPLALTAVLILRVLFRTAFASAEAAPKADADHFGFPGAVEDTDPANVDAQGADEERDKEGERRGRKAFVGVRSILENIRLRDEALMSWVTEMVDATIPDLH
jgi:chromatin structure-remodeling complex subunit RSC9